MALSQQAHHYHHPDAASSLADIIQRRGRTDLAGHRDRKLHGIYPAFNIATEQEGQDIIGTLLPIGNYQDYTYINDTKHI